MIGWKDKPKGDRIWRISTARRTVIIRVIGEIGYDYNFRSFSYCRRSLFLGITAVLSFVSLICEQEIPGSAVHAILREPGRISRKDCKAICL